MMTKGPFSRFVCMFTARHSLQYVYTSVSGEINFPEFTAVYLVDNVQFMYFDSNTMKAVPKTEWIRQNEGADYWNGETQKMIGQHQLDKNNIQVAKERFNQSAGKLVGYQRTYTHYMIIDKDYKQYY